MGLSTGCRNFIGQISLNYLQTNVSIPPSSSKKPTVRAYRHKALVLPGRFGESVGSFGDITLVASAALPLRRRNSWTLRQINWLRFDGAIDA